MLLLFYLATLLQPNSRTLFYPGKVMTAWTEEEGALSIRWSTDLPVIGSRVRYRAKCHEDHFPERWRFKRSHWEMKQKSHWMIWECVHTVIIRDLNPRCMYEYQVGTGLLWSPLSQVSGRTPFYRSHGDRKPAKLAVVADLGLSSDSENTKTALRSYLNRHQVDAVIHAGDIAYALDDHGGKVGDEYLQSMDGIINTCPYMVLPGNHEAANNFTHYKWRFRMPVSEANQGTNLFYSFNLGSAHFVALNTEIWAYNSLEAAETMTNWLISDLTKAAMRRSEIPWVIIFGHKPLYCSVDWRRPVHKYKCNINCNAEAASLRERLESVFERFKVDVYIAGHVHRYERMAPIKNNRTALSEIDTDHLHFNPTAPLYIVNGSGGNNHGPDDLASTSQLWSQVQSAASGFGALTVFNHTHLLWEQLEGATERRVDYVWVVKD